jgi:hypothetical protein
MLSHTKDTHRSDTAILLAALGFWGAAVAILSATGAYHALNQLMIGPIIFLGIAIPSTIYFLFPNVRQYFEHLGLRWITAIHIGRIPAALLFFWYGAHGLLPETFVYSAGWGDSISGVLALVLMLVPKGRAGYLGMHAFGFMDFFAALGLGVYFTLVHDPHMGSIRDLPLALIPLWYVGILGTTHVIAFDLLRRKGDCDRCASSSPDDGDAYSSA